MTQAAVFGGGGIAGIAWETGMVLGLRQAGVDLCTADLVVGTSAGSIVGSHVASGSDLRALVQVVESRAPGAQSAPPAPDLDAIMAVLAPLFDAGMEPIAARRRIGAA